MARLSKTWRLVAAIFVVVNVLGIGYALAMGEANHATAHALILAGFGLGWLLGPWRERRTASPAQISDPRVEYLQQSVDAVALEVERLGEKQRFAEKLRAESAEGPPSNKPRSES